MDSSVTTTQASADAGAKRSPAFWGLWALALGSLAATILAWQRSEGRLRQVLFAEADEAALIRWTFARDLGTGLGWIVAGALALVLAAVCLRSGRRASVVLPLLIALASPWVGRSLLGGDPPQFDRHLTTLDLLARPDLWEIVTQNSDQAPALRVLTPAVDQHSDSGDKPALWMAPPCEVRIEVPKGLPAGYLRLAAGVDKLVRNRLPKGMPEIAVEFEVEIDGELRFSERITNERTKPGVWRSDDWTWRHAADDALPVKGGAQIVLRTRIPEGHPSAALPASLLVAGFGGCVVETRVATPRAEARPDAPNIILIVQDTLRADRTSTYGYGRETSPVLTKLAERGLLFEQAYSTSSWTWPSTASLLTGLAPEAHGVVSNESCTLNLALSSLPEVLQARGYTTAAFSCNPLIVPARNFDQGFEDFDFHSSEFRKSDDVMTSVFSWLVGHDDARFFLYLHLADPHTPHRPRQEDLDLFGGVKPPGFPDGGLDEFGGQYWRAFQETGAPPNLAPEMTRWVDDVYDASIRTGDFWLGELLSYLDEKGLTENTVIAFSSDHGEELLDRGRVGHGHGLHTELVRVPLVIAGPGIPAGQRIVGPVSNRHLAPTLAVLGGSELPGMGDGGMLIPGMEPNPPEEVMFATSKGWVAGRNYQELIGLRSGTSTLIWWDGEQGGQVSLFDEASDPLQLQNLATEREQEASRLQGIAGERRADQRAWAPAHRIGVGAAGTEMLTGIGYLGGEEEEK